MSFFRKFFKKAGNTIKKGLGFVGDQIKSTAGDLVKGGITSGLSALATRALPALL